MFKLATCIALLLSAAPEMMAQKKGKAPAPVEMSVTQVNDRRGGEYFERLALLVELPKIPAGDVVAARVLLKSASDDAGTNLIPEDMGEPGLEMIGGGSTDEEDRKQPARLSFDLAKPARTASRVKEVRGEVELYMPSKDSNSIAVIPKFLSSKGKALSHKALKANGVEIALLSDQQFEAEKKRLAEARRQELIREDYPEDVIAGLVNDFLEYFPTPEPNDVVVRIKDPKGVLQQFDYVDPAGKETRLITREDQGLTFISTWEGPPADDHSLRISMKTAKSLARYPFVLANVELP